MIKSPTGNIGVMWFVVMQLVLDLGYHAWRRVMKNRPECLASTALPKLVFPKFPSSRWRWWLSAICFGSSFHMARPCSNSWRDIIEVQRANTQKVIESRKGQGGVCDAQI